MNPVKIHSTIPTRPGTIGHEIQELLDKHSSTPTGMYVLERALQLATGAKAIQFVDDEGKTCMMQETPRFLAMENENRRVIEETYQSIAQEYQPS